MGRIAPRDWAEQRIGTRREARFRDDHQRQRWMAFLRNHHDAISAMDFFVVPTVRFQLLYVWFVIDSVR